MHALWDATGEYRSSASDMPKNANRNRTTQRDGARTSSWTDAIFVSYLKVACLTRAHPSIRPQMISRIASRAFQRRRPHSIRTLH